MKARISLPGKVSKKQQEVARELVKEQFRNEAQGHTRRLLKIFCSTLNESEGYGKIKLGRVLDRIIKIADEHMNDEVYWYHVDKRVIDQLGIPFEREDYDIVDR